MSASSNPVGRVPSRGDSTPGRDAAGSGDPAYNMSTPSKPVGRVPSHGDSTPGRDAAGSGGPAYNMKASSTPVGRVRDEPPPRRLRRLHRVWPDREGNISYLLTLCVDGRTRVLDNEATSDRLIAFLLDSPSRYHWFGRRFVVMPDHIHLIAHMGHDAIPLGQWIKALKAVVGGLGCRQTPGPVGRVPSHGDSSSGTDTAGSGDPAYNMKASSTAVGRVPSHGDSSSGTDTAGSGDPAYNMKASSTAVGRVPSHGDSSSGTDTAGSGDPAYNMKASSTAVGRVPSRGDSVPSRGASGSKYHEHDFIRNDRSWRWEAGFHDHKFRTPESETRKWEYICLNPVRYGLVERPEQWPFGGEIYYEDTGGPRVVRGTPPLLEAGILIAEEIRTKKEPCDHASGVGTRPTT